MKVLVSGGSGFVGGAVLARLAREPGLSSRATVRSFTVDLCSETETVLVDALSPSCEWKHAARGCDIVVHAAARVHERQASEEKAFSLYRDTNSLGTVRFARQAAAVGVRRFVYLSSIKVHGEKTEPGSPFSASSPLRPTDAYSRSKSEAETGLFALAKETGLEVVILRPTLVYGPGVRANFLTMLRWIHAGLPLPFGAVRNLRSFVAIDNLVDLVVCCLTHPLAANECFLVSDGDDLSTPELIERASAALNVSARLLSVPPTLLSIAAALVHRQKLIGRLLDSLQVDIEKTRRLLAWTPPVQVNDALARTALYYLQGLSSTTVAVHRRRAR